jgi:LPXTG-motif cell wall-anchored protein
MLLSLKAGNAWEGGHNEQIGIARDRTNSYDFGTQYAPGNVAPVDPTGYCMYDVIDLMDNLGRFIPMDSDISAAASAVKTAANDAIAYSAVNQYHGDWKNANGLTIYFPSGQDTQYSESFDEVEFAIDSYWDEFLHFYHDDSNAPDTPPGILITSPDDDVELVRGHEKTFQVQGTAYDAQNGISLIEIKIDDDGEWAAVGASSQWYYDISFSKMENGNHTISARAYDGVEYSSEDSIEVYVVGEKGPENSGQATSTYLLAIIVMLLLGLSGYYAFKKRKSRLIS